MFTVFVFVFVVKIQKCRYSDPCKSKSMDSLSKEKLKGRFTRSILQWEESDIKSMYALCVNSLPHKSCVITNIKNLLIKPIWDL